MLVTDGAVSAGDGTLDVAEGGIDPFECGDQGGLATRSGDDWLMGASGVANAGKTSQAIADNGAGGIEVAPRQDLKRFATEPFDTAQLDADRLALQCRLDCGDDRGLASSAAPRLPPFRSPPISASSISIRPARRFPASRSIITCISLCLIFQAVVWVTPRRRPSSRLAMPPLLWVRWYMARNQTRSGNLVAAKIDPAISEVCRWQAVH